MAAFSYTSRDFSTIRADMLARAEVVMPEWVERDPSDFGMLLVDLWAHAADIMHYYIDRAAGEANLSTATQRESIIALANLLDYTPRGRTSAFSTVTFANSSSVTVVIPQYSTLISRYNNKSYQSYTMTAGSVPANSTLNIVVSEGTRYVDEIITSSGTGGPGQRYSLSASNVDPYSTTVYVLEDGLTPTQYRRVNRLADAPTGDRVYSVYSASDGSTQITFGTYLNGFSPPAGSVVKASYVESAGYDGNIPANCVVSFSGTTPNNISIVSSTSFTSGTDAESIDSLKRSIPSASGTNNRAVTRADFIALATQVPGVAKASLTFTAGGVGSNASVTIYPQIYRSDYLTSTSSSEVVSSATSTAVINTLQPLALLGVTVLCAPTISWTYIDIGMELHVQDRFVQADVVTAVSTALDALFDFDNVFFGQRFHLGQVYRIINAVEGVDYVSINKFNTSALSGATPMAPNANFVVDALSLPKKSPYAITAIGGLV